MINFIKGIVDDINEASIVIECNGIGYTIFTGTNTINNLQIGSNAKIYTYMAVREDEISLYGFLTKEEIKLFNQLISVSGVGPKSAVSLLSTMSPSQLSLAIITDDIKTISSGVGIGRKTAQRIALELKDKISNEQAVEDSTIITQPTTKDSSAKAEALEALISLGFSKNEANNAISVVYNNDTDSSKLISKALKVLS